MTSYESAIASSESEDERIYENALGIIRTTRNPTILPREQGGRIAWSCEVITASRSVTSQPREYDPESLDTLVEAAQELISRGAVVVILDNGFSSMQRDLATRLSVPVCASSMIQVASLKIVTDSHVGIVTLDRQLLSQWHLVAVNATDTPVIGLPVTSTWRRQPPIESQPESKDAESYLIADLVNASRLLITHHQVRAIVFEEPRFSIFTAQVQARLKIPIYDLVSTANWLLQTRVYERQNGERQEDASIISIAPDLL